MTTWLKDLLPEIGIASEHGFYMRKPQSDTWEVAIANMDFGWKDSVQGIVEGYAECTDGSFVEVKDASVVWHYRNADPDFGRWQAKELVDHLEGVLQGAPVEVVAGQGTAYVETKPVGVSKGHVAEKILSASQQAADFVFCVGDDRSDEAMFSVLENMAKSTFELMQRQSAAVEDVNLAMQRLQAKLDHPASETATRWSPGVSRGAEPRSRADATGSPFGGDGAFFSRGGLGRGKGR